MINLKFTYEQALEFVSKEQIHGYQEEINKHYEAINNKTGKGNDFLGWVALPDEIGEASLDEIINIAESIPAKSEVVVLIGIGGSYQGARAVIYALSHHFKDLVRSIRFHVLFAGQNISADYIADLMEVLDQNEYSLIVISKSGITTEPAIAFRILKNHLESKYGLEEARRRIVTITDKEKGALKQLANDEGYKTFVVPDDVGGRYSVFTPIGLLPIAVAGFDINKLITGAKTMKKHVEEFRSIDNNPVFAYAAVRNALYRNGFTTEIIAYYEPRLFYFTEWWKQLYGESEGKENKGIYPSSVGYTAHLHSLGQYIQEGLRNLFETVISIKNPERSLIIPLDRKNLDNINYIAGMPLHIVNHMAELGTTLAHVDGGVPNLSISIPKINENTLGELIYFFEMACAISGYLLGVNPFDQPGVKAYKDNMFALLGKPGLEKKTEKIRKRL